MAIRRVFIGPGQAFGRWIVLHEVPATNQYRTRYRCQCQCGRIKNVDGLTLRNGTSQSCGCFRYEPRNVTHGLSKTTEYKIWIGIKKRCYQPRTKGYMNYGGRGIVMCDEWRDDPVRFIQDMGPRPRGYTIDRVNNDGHYAPGNCRWATRREQAWNTRHNRPLTFRGETLLLSQWAMKLGESSQTLSKRLSRGWTLERTLSKREH